MMKYWMVVLLVVGALANASPVLADHVVFMLGEREYHTGESLREFFDTELKPVGYTATFIAAPAEGDEKNDFAGFAEALEAADLVVVSVRRRAPAKADLDALRKFLAAGKPLIGIRTASHAFHLKGNAVPEGHAIWEEFDPAVLGGNYDGHFGNHSFVISVAKGAADHPILEGVNLKKSVRLYRSGPLADSTTPLLLGKLGDKPIEPVAWTNIYGPKKARIFHTSLGSVEDFKGAGFRRMFLNAFEWALGSE